jgi:ribosome-associated protein
MLEINKSIKLSENDFSFQYSRSSGPGGQNVNKLNTRVTLFFDVPNCSALSDSQKNRILKKLSTRSNKDGIIRVVSQKYRTQNANRRAAIERLAELITKALKTNPRRKKTAVPRWAKEKRLAEKKKRSKLKKLRGSADTEQ